MEIKFDPIGYIESPYKNIAGIPKQSIYEQVNKGTIVLHDEFMEGARDIEAGQYIVIVFYFHQSKKCDLVQIPRDKTQPKGVFSTRSPHRPNGVGISIVKVISTTGKNIEFLGVDMLDGTPVIDIKPYIVALNPLDAVDPEYV